MLISNRLSAKVALTSETEDGKTTNQCNVTSKTQLQTLKEENT